MTDDGTGATVTRDMERVFAGLGGAARREPGTRTLQPRPEAARPGLRLLAWALVAALAAAIVLVAYFVPRPVAPIAPRPSAAAPDVKPAPARAIVAEAVPHPAMRPPPSATKPAAQPSAVKRAAATVPHRGRADPRVTASGPTRAASAETRPAEAPAPAAPASEPLLCQDAADAAGCLYRQVLDADRRLRRAYEAAAAAGVPTAEMRRTRASWKRAISRSRKEPLVSAGTLEGLIRSLRNSIRSAPGRPG